MILHSNKDLGLPIGRRVKTIQNLPFNIVEQNLEKTFFTGRLKIFFTSSDEQFDGEILFENGYPIVASFSSRKLSDFLSGLRNPLNLKIIKFTYTNSELKLALVNNNLNEGPNSSLEDEELSEELPSPLASRNELLKKYRIREFNDIDAEQLIQNAMT